MGIVSYENHTYATVFPQSTITQVGEIPFGVGETEYSAHINNLAIRTWTTEVRF